ncbi:MAG: hypothetical protein IJM46_12590 [Oscillospiraceae bacterium]|nr:hypothetical protein [Oscillospiraceae bacterium]
MKLAVSREELFLSPFACCDELAKHRRASAVPVFNLCAQRIPQLFSPTSSFLLPTYYRSALRHIRQKTKAAFSRMRRLLWLRVNFERAIDLSLRNGEQDKSKAEERMDAELQTLTLLIL